MRDYRSGVAFLTLLACRISPAHGETSRWNRVVLVELFTSQGCSSCPAADALVRELPRLGYSRDRVLPLTFHVNYWDGLGWKDPFSSPAFTARQQWYADSGKLRSPDVHASAREIYTPQMVVNGSVHFSGARRTVALAELQRAGAGPASVSVAGTAAIDGESAVVTVRVSGTARPDPSWRLFVALAARAARTPVSSGENGGRTLEETDVVRALSGPLPLRPGPVRLIKPPSLRWPDVEIVAFVQSLTSLEVAGAGAIQGRVVSESMILRAASPGDIDEIIAIDDDACALYEQAGLHVELGPERWPCAQRDLGRCGRVRRHRGFAAGKSQGRHR